MDTRRPVRCARCGDCRSANEAWKDRWGEVVRWSAAAAVAVHVGVLGFWPERQIDPPERYAASVPTLIVPVAQPGTQVDALTGSAFSEVPPERAEARPDPTPPPREARGGSPLDALRRPTPRLVRSNPSLSIDGPPALSPLDRVRFAPTNVVLSDHDTPALSFSWPEIRNPRAMVRYLREQYNAIHDRIVPERFVSVAIWINDRGGVEWSEVRESSGDPNVDKIALSVVNEVMEFIPASREGAPVSVAVVLSIPFQVPW
jgi:TonB family protein